MCVVGTFKFSEKYYIICCGKCVEMCSRGEEFQLQLTTMVHSKTASATSPTSVPDLETKVSS